MRIKFFMGHGCGTVFSEVDMAPLPIEYMEKKIW